MKHHIIDDTLVVRPYTVDGLSPLPPGNETIPWINYISDLQGQCGLLYPSTKM